MVSRAKVFLIRWMVGIFNPQVSVLVYPNKGGSQSLGWLVGIITIVVSYSDVTVIGCNALVVITIGVTKHD